MRWRLEGKAAGKFPLSHSLVSNNRHVLEKCPDRTLKGMDSR